MKTLIGYVSRHGCAESCANEIYEKLGEEADVVDLKKNKKIDFSEYGRVVLGGSIHAGRVQGYLKKFCQQHLNELLSKELALYLCCMEKSEKAQVQFDNAFSEQLRKHATASALLGGQFNFEKMNFFEKAAIRKIAGVDESVDDLDHAALDAFVADILK